MDVQLYVYDLSKGLARQFSQQFLGTYIDAVYHTAIIIQGIEYFFGAGVQTTYAGSTHHGRPMEVIWLGKTELPMEVILEYLESLKEIYTAESYDLFMHNCNNFSNDFAMFLVGKGIPGHITSLPQTVLNTPFGMMLRPQLDQAMRTVTQAPVVPVTPPSSAQTVATQDKKLPYATDPSHPHNKLDKTMKTLRMHEARQLHFGNMPTLDKLIAKLGDQGKDPIVTAMKDFLTQAQSKVPQNAKLPSLPDFATWMESSIQNLPLEAQFAAYDLCRLALSDERVSAYFAEKSHSQLILDLLKHVNELGDSCPYNLRLVSCQLSCNFLGSKVARAEVPKSAPHCAEIMSLALSTLLDEKREGATARTAAAWTACNLASANFGARLEHRGMDEEQEVELLAGLLSALEAEPKSESERVPFLISAIGLLVWHTPVDGGVADLCRSLDALATVKQRTDLTKDNPQIGEVSQLLEALQA